MAWGRSYRARDTKLNRQVALKILPEAFAANPDRLARFQPEAQVLAYLNRPNIGTKMLSMLQVRSTPENSYEMPFDRHIRHALRPQTLYSDLPRWRADYSAARERRALSQLRVTTAGAAYCWGWNHSEAFVGARGGFGQLGDGTTTASNVPVVVLGGLTFQSVSAGNIQNCGVTTAGTAYCWGWNVFGQLGDRTNTNSNVPVAVLGGLTFQSVSAGSSSHSCGVTTAGAAYCWGDNGGGQFGNGTTTASNVPMAVLGGLTFQSVSAGSSHSCGVTTAGAAYCWGDNGGGQFGNGTTTASNVPMAVLGGLTFQSVSPGYAHSCGVTTAGVAYCWGGNDFGELGDGTTTASNVPVAVLGGLTFQSVSPGYAHSCGVTTAGVAYCWGGNDFGELGDGTTTASNVPVAVLGGLTFQSVSAGYIQNCGVTTAGAAYCWVGTCSASSGMARPRPATCRWRSRAGSPSSQ